MRALLVSIAAIAALAPGAALADGAVDAFQTICVATSAQPAAVKSRAEAQGFVAPPAELVGKMQVPGMTKVTGLWRTVEGGMQLILWGDGRIPGATPIAADVCAVAMMPQLPDPASTLQQLLGVGPPVGEGARQMFVYDENAGSKTAIAAGDNRALNAALNSGRLRVSAGQNQGNMSMMLVMAARPAK